MEKPHILIVDDEPLVLASVSDLLEFEYTVHQSDNPHEALSIIKDDRYELKVIMSDQRMPGMYGHELLREAKKIRPNTIRLLLTGYSDLESIMYSVNVGEIFRYINKPWKSETLLNVFRLAVKLYDQMMALDTSKHAKKSLQKELPEQEQPEEVKAETKTVLMIGYSDKVFDHYHSVLKSKYNVVNVHTTQEALDDLKKMDVSVIVSEINLGITSTLDFLIKIKQGFPNVVTIMLTKSIDANFAIRAINDLNVFRYLTPPIDDDEFRSLVDEAFRRSDEFKSKTRLDLFRSHKSEVESSNSLHNKSSDLRSNLKAAQDILSKKKGY